MADYTITTTAAEEIALKPVMSNKQTWLENAIQERARKSGDSIIIDLIEHCNANGITIATGRDAQLQQADDLGLVFDASTGQVVHE